MYFIEYNRLVLEEPNIYQNLEDSEGYNPKVHDMPAFFRTRSLATDGSSAGAPSQTFKSEAGVP